MKLSYLALAASLLAAAPATAQISAVAGGANAASVGADPFSNGGYSSVAYRNDFSTTTNPRFSPSVFTATGTSVPGGYYSAPFGDTTQYAYVAPYTNTGVAGNSPVTFSTAGLGNFNQVSLLWGSQDSFNTLSFLGAGGSVIQSFTGSSFGSGNGATTSYVTFSLSPSVVGTVTGISFASNGLAAFEFDNLTVGNAVPEAATWAMMMVGLGVAGGSLRRRKAKVSVGYAA